jgi:hypothetical protein
MEWVTGGSMQFRAAELKMAEFRQKPSVQGRNFEPEFFFGR